MYIYTYIHIYIYIYIYIHIHTYHCEIKWLFKTKFRFKLQCQNWVIQWHASAKQCQNKALKEWLAERYSWITQADNFKAPNKKMILLDMTHHHFIWCFPSLYQGCMAYWCLSPVFETQVDMSMSSTGRRGTNRPDRGTEGLARYFYWKQLLKSIQQMPRASMGQTYSNVMSPNPQTPRIWAEAIALAKRQAGHGVETRWSHGTWHNDCTTFLRLFMTFHVSLFLMVFHVFF